jgi:DNA-binding Lrp family transcriptional regulator
MVKTNTDQIEQDEKKVLFELVKNSNESVDTIAKHCGFSRQKTWKFIKRLEGKGFIWGYTAIFDEEKIGLNHFMLLAKRTMKPYEEGTSDKIISRKLERLVAEMGITIESSFYVHGEYDWVITFTAEDIKHAKKFSDLFVLLYPGVIGKITILQTLIFIRKQYILNPEKKNLKELL